LELVGVKDALFEQHLDLARRIACGFARKLPRIVAREDIEQAALIGLHQWCSAHPDSSHPGWRSGLTTRVRGAIIDWLRAEDWLPRRARANGASEVLHLEDLSRKDGPGWQDILGECDESEFSARVDALAALEADMPERDRHLVIETFARDTTQRDLALELGVSEPRVSQLLTRATRKMRAHLEREREIVTAPRAAVQVLATPVFRVRDFKRELWLARRAELLAHTGGGRSMRDAARSLGISCGTLLRWCDSTQMSWVSLTNEPNPINAAVQRRGKELIVAALRAAAGSGGRAGPLLRLSRTALCRWRSLLIPDAPQCRNGPVPRVPHATLAALYQRGLSQRQIGREVGLHHASVAHALRTQGIAGRINLAPREDVSVEVCVGLKSQGLSHRQIAGRFGCSPGLVAKRMREARAS
jgi:RNA polymerase sigma factor (sigma-70 family)